MTETVDRAEARRWFNFGCVCELSAGILAAVIAQVAGLPWASAIHWDIQDAAWGVAATAPMLVLFWWMLTTRWRPLREIADFLDHTARPILGQWNWTQLAVISIIAGFSEELLFRAVIQGGLTPWLGPAWSVVLASAVFGAFHWVTHAYAGFATLIGVYLGLIWLASGNLLTPVVTHALYDFIALAWLFKVRGQRGPEAEPG